MSDNIITLQDNNIESKIYTIRSQQVMLDNDLAKLYQIETKQLNKAVNRNMARFPQRFRFQLTEDEFKNLRFQTDTSNIKHGGRRYLPYVFTEQGISMLSAILRSDIAIEVSIKIIDTFVQMKRYISSNELMFQRFQRVENRLSIYDENFNAIFKALENKNSIQEQGIFYNGQIFDAHIFVSNLIKNAKKSIALIDNYIDDTVLTILSKNQNVDIVIYTHTISKQLKQDLDKYNAQYRHLTIKNFKNSHDRFLIIDDKELYHIGASFKDLGKKIFAFSKMDIEIFEFLEKLKR